MRFARGVQVITNCYKMQPDMNTIKERKKCPKCERGELDTRTSRGFIVKTFLFWLPIKRYRCNECWRKSYIYGSVWLDDKEELSKQLV